MSVNKYDSATDTLTKVAGNATVPIDDTTSATDKVYSSSKVESKFSANRTNRTFSTLADYIISLDCHYGDIQYCGSDYTDVPIIKDHWGQGYFFGYKSDMITIIISANTGSIFYIGNLKVSTKEITWKQLATTDDTEFGTKSITEITQAIPSRQMGFMVSYGNNITGRPTNSSAWGVVRAYRYGATIVMYYEETSDNCETYKAMYNSDGTVKKAWAKIY